MTLPSQRQFDFVVISCHGTGRNAILGYILQNHDVDLAITGFQHPYNIIERLQDWCDKNKHKYLGLVIDYPMPMNVNDKKFMSLFKYKFSILFTCRDIIDHIKSFTNHVEIYNPLLIKNGLRKKYSNIIPIDNINNIITKVIYNFLKPPKPVYKGPFYWHKLVAQFRNFADSTAVFEFNDLLDQSSIPEFMRKLGIVLFNDQEFYNVKVFNSSLGSQINSIFNVVHPIYFEDKTANFKCTLRPYPCELWEHRGRDHEMRVASYSPSSIGWAMGNFPGELGLYCLENEIVESGLSKREFKTCAKKLLEENFEGNFAEYVHELNVKTAKVEEEFSHLKISPEQVIEVLRNGDPAILARYQELIRSQAEELASVGLDVTDRWVHARELLGPQGFSRPAAERDSHLRELIRELQEQWGKSEEKLVTVSSELCALQESSAEIQKNLKQNLDVVLSEQGISQEMSVKIQNNLGQKLASVSSELCTLQESSTKIRKDLEKQIVSLTSELHKTQRTLAEEKARLQALRQSLSWRITRPLRVLGRKLGI